MRVFLLNSQGPRGLSYKSALSCLKSLQLVGRKLAGREAVMEPDERGFYFLFVESPYIADEFLVYLQGCIGVLTVQTDTLDGSPLDFDVVTTKPEVWQRLRDAMMYAYGKHV